MPVMLTYFDPKIGPDPFIVIPRDFDEKLVNENIKTMNYTPELEEFFTTEHPESGIKSINLQFKLNSPEARGSCEQIQLTVFTTEQYPPMLLLKQKMMECKKMMVKKSEIYKAFYCGKDTEFVDSRDMREYCHDIMKWLNNEVKTDTPFTKGRVSRTGKMMTDGIDIPQSVRNVMQNIAFVSGKNHFFYVFRRDGRGKDSSITIKLFPTDGKILKLRLIATDFTSMTMLRLATAIPYPIPFTTGLCQEKSGKCSYEAYFDYGDSGKDFEMVKEEISEKLGEIDFIDDFEILPVKRE